MSVPATLRIGKCERRILTYLSTHDDGKYEFLCDTFYELGDHSRSVESSYNRSAHRLERLGFIEITLIREWGNYRRARLGTSVKLTEKGRSWLRRDRE